MKTKDSLYVSKQQTYEHSSGAVSLLCAAKELGVEKLPLLKGSQLEVIGEEELTLNQHCESIIYRITSGLNWEEQSSEKLKLAGYSMPHHIVTAATLLALESEVYLASEFYDNSISYFYPDAAGRLPKYEKSVHQYGPKELENDERQMSVLAVKLFGAPAGLHWVMKRPDGSLMDPGTGKNTPDFLTLNQTMQSGSNRLVSYEETGISIVLKVKETQHEDSTLSEGIRA
ncbi:hypothetical protein [Algicola sagamiensis]|uniref:hypothetical protein n=1 Tax=Algicola sagamiensis TaxID=163869 RepID=UPI00036F77CC|nr:hypothetical protein [Algicola sagamiensis]